MLFIFRVDLGCMLNLDMDLALETVANLKTAVASSCNIPVDKQVLLISGGESLEPEERVCKYTAGSSDSNPIFLFSVSTLEETSPPIFPEIFQDPDLQAEVEASLSLPDTYNTVAVRANLAQAYIKVSCEQMRLCESEIHDQHLQHQGWAAALANLDDSVFALQKKITSFEDAYKQYLEKREHYRSVVETFDDDIHVLSKIPVLSALLENNDIGKDCTFPAECGSLRIHKSLLEWINEAGNSSLEQVADSCYRSLEQMDNIFLEGIRTKIYSEIEAANNQQMKEIGGLGDRLSGLEQLMLDAKKKVAEQKDLATAFLQNQARASGLKDVSILPDLCASHKQQLLVMIRNHQHIFSIRKRCVKAKEELSRNLYARLKWVMFIQRQMAESGQQLVLYFEELKRLSRRLEVIEQLHLAPSMYLATVVEVIRRKSFSEQFLKKCRVLAYNFSDIYSEELKTRQTFQEKLDKHFLSSMFKGMEDIPPAFATQEPDSFDEKLPQLGLGDLEQLRNLLPELEESLSVQTKKDLSSQLTRNLSKADCKRLGVEEILGLPLEDEDTALETTINNSATLLSSTISNLRVELDEIKTKVESEKLCLFDTLSLINSHLTRYSDKTRICHEDEALKNSSIASVPHVASTSENSRLLEVKQENDERIEQEVELKEVQSGDHAKVKELESKLSSLNEMYADKDSEFKELVESYSRLQSSQEDKIKEEKDKMVDILEAGFNERERVALSQLKEQLETLHSGLLQEAQQKNELKMCSRMEELRQKMIESSQINLNRVIEKKEKQHQEELLANEAKLRSVWETEKQNLEELKQKEIQEITEKLKQKSKMEVENLRSRFKIMKKTATLESSSCNSELEVSDEKLVNADRIRIEAEKQVMFNEAIKKAVEDKDRKIRELEERLRTHGKPIPTSDLESKLADMARKNEVLESQMKELTQKLSLEMTSVAIESEGGLKQLKEENLLLREQLSRSMTSVISSEKVNVNSAEKGDIVLVVWSNAHSNYVIYNESSVPHFLHTESVDLLGLTPPERDGSVLAHTRFMTAEVTGKEYCLARKSENRFNVAQGTKFYRIKCKRIENDLVPKC